MLSNCGSCEDSLELLGQQGDQTSQSYNPEYSLERLMLKLKLQYFGHPMRRADSLEKSLMLVNTEGKRRRGRLRIRQLDSLTNSMDMNLNKLQEIMKDRGDWCAAVHGIMKSQTRFSD